MHPLATCLRISCCKDNGRALVTRYLTAKASSKPKLVLYPREAYYISRNCLENRLANSDWEMQHFKTASF
jgi:hypothetical protein